MSAHFRRAEELGHIGAMDELAHCDSVGRGTAVDYAQAMRWARRAADLGHANAMNTVGALYAGGQGVPADRAEAVRWFERAIAAGIREGPPVDGLRFFVADGFAPAAAALRRLGLE